MGVYSVPVTIGVDEERIAQEIEKNVEDRVVARITNEVESIIYARSLYGRQTDGPLRDMITMEIGKCIEENEDLIVKEAAKILADKMARTKAVREATKNVVEKAKGD